VRAEQDSRMARPMQTGSEEKQSFQFALDELRMLMLGTQVLLGFQLEALFQDAFGSPTDIQRIASSAAFGCIVMTLALLITTPSVHRITDEGHATHRTQWLARLCSKWALASFAVALSADTLVVTYLRWPLPYAVVAFFTTLTVCWIAWYAIGAVMGRRRSRGGDFVRASISNQRTHTPLHKRIDHLLTEARVILPGAQALLGFQFIVTLTKAFGDLPEHVRALHFGGLVLVLAAIVLLIAPAAIHRLAFDGEDDRTFLQVASRIVTAALLPLALGIGCETYVAAYKLFDGSGAPLVAGFTAVAVLLTLWYLLPWRLRRVNRSRSQV
jgi:Family of unknown function (DUF6328)